MTLYVASTWAIRAGSETGGGVMRIIEEMFRERKWATIDFMLVMYSERGTC